jgi:Trk K+ transport system NAD-binding subunit
LAVLGETVDASVVLAATDEDERNLIIASLAKHRGAGRTAAVIQSPSLAACQELAGALKIDRIIRPQAELAASLASHLRGSVASAVQSLGTGRIRIAELTVGPAWRAVGLTLRDLALPAGARIAVIRREDHMVAPSAAVTVQAGDRVLLVANQAALAESVDRVGGAAENRTLSALVVADQGDTTDAEGFVRALRETEMTADLTDPKRLERSVGEFETLVLFNPTPAMEALAHQATQGAKVVAVTEREEELPSRTPCLSAPIEIARVVSQLLPRPPVERVGTIGQGVLCVYRVEAGDAGEWLEIPLRELKALKGWTVLAVQAGTRSYLPHPDDVISPHDILIIAGPPSGERTLEQGLRGA